VSATARREETRGLAVAAIIGRELVRRGPRVPRVPLRG
jgi:hypothetical protein